MKIKNSLMVSLLMILALLTACQSQKHLKTHIVPQQTQFYQGNHYRLAHAQYLQQANDGKIHITEFFLYGCPHCYSLEPKIKHWLSQQKNIVFERVPAIIGPTWVEMARFYYVAEYLGVLQTLHTQFFDEIHNSGKQYYSEIAIRTFFLKNGISEQDYLKAYNSAQVKQKTNRARILSVQYGLRGVPVIIMNNQWKVAPFYVKNQKQVFDVLDYLISLQTKEKQHESED